MRAKTIIELMSLSATLYSIAKDKEFFERLHSMAEKGKEFVDEFSEEDEEGETQIIQKLIEKAGEAKVEIEKKMEEVAIAVYGKMHIAHTDEVKKLEEQVNALRTELALAEARIVNLETAKTSNS
ncbi:MAG: hypothetical protein POELPBGB_02806 [Bacteroidia bacterium]|nr:hypothetical protein [Bacteroidia bacterium]